MIKTRQLSELKLLCCWFSVWKGTQHVKNCLKYLSSGHEYKTGKKIKSSFCICQLSVLGITWWCQSSVHSTSNWRH